MHSSTNSIISSTTNTSPKKSAPPAELSDSQLLVATRLLVGRSNQVIASLLAHLAEVEARGVHRTRACSSLYTYCIYELRFSEDEAYRCVAAARLVRRFPALLEAIGAGELHLTGLLMLGPHLTEGNLAEVLARAKHRTKKEIARLVRLLDPLPDVPSRIEPLGPAPARNVLRAPTWSQFIQATSPVRELVPGDRPREWITDDGSDFAMTSEPRGASVLDAHASPVEQSIHAVAPEGASPALERPAPPPERLVPQRYSVQFTASEEYVKLVEEAQALSTSRMSLDELHVQAMRALVAELKRRKYTLTTRPRQRSRNSPTSPEAPNDEAESTPAAPETGAVETVPVPPENPTPLSAKPRQRGRYTPAEVRRAVFERDQGRCSFTDSSGRRCRETHHLELHHELAFALGGEHTAANLTLRCRAHNALASEEDFGKEFVEQQRESEHERWTTQATEPR